MFSTKPPKKLNFLQGGQQQPRIARRKSGTFEWNCVNLFSCSHGLHCFAPAIRALLVLIRLPGVSTAKMFLPTCDGEARTGHGSWDILGSFRPTQGGYNLQPQAPSTGWALGFAQGPTWRADARRRGCRLENGVLGTQSGCQHVSMT